MTRGLHSPPVNSYKLSHNGNSRDQGSFQNLTMEFSFISNLFPGGWLQFLHGMFAALGNFRKTHPHSF
jgi:hypothetical protein